MKPQASRVPLGRRPLTTKITRFW